MKIIATIVALAFSIFVATAADQKAVPAEFVKLYAQWDAALVKADVAALGKIYADEARLVSPDGEMETKADFIGQVKSGEYKAANPSTTELQVTIHGDTAVATCVWKADETIKGEKVAGHYRFTDVWIKRDGRWQVVASQGTPIKASK